jgi:pimeloyl-ACP methyl ester carboxylesterase
VTLLLVLGIAAWQAPSIAASALLHPWRRGLNTPTPSGCTERDFTGEEVELKGWHCAAVGVRRGTIVYLHGVADNRSSGVGVIQRFTPRGFDVVAYDSRAHGESGGDLCTYGYYEKLDLRRVVETLAEGPVVFIGASLGGAVALQAAVDQPRVRAVVAAEPFSDLRTIALERAPRLMPEFSIRAAFRVAEQRGRFRVDEVSPLVAARSLRSPVLLIHGADDRDTPPDHSRRIAAALAGAKRLILVPTATHNRSLGGAGIWTAIDEWIEDALHAGG